MLKIQEELGADWKSHMLPPAGKATLLSWSLQEQARLRDTLNYIIEEFENPIMGLALWSSGQLGTITKY